MSSRKAYLVERAAFSAADFDRAPFLESGYEDEPSFTPVRAFADYEAADAHAAELTAEARAALPAALFAGYEMPGGSEGLVALAERFGLPPPEFSARGLEDGDEFREWWAAYANDLTPEQRAAAWDLVDDVELYRVREITVED